MNDKDWHKSFSNFTVEMIAIIHDYLQEPPSEQSDEESMNRLYEMIKKTYPLSHPYKQGLPLDEFLKTAVLNYDQAEHKDPNLFVVISILKALANPDKKEACRQWGLLMKNKTEIKAEGRKESSKKANEARKLKAQHKPIIKKIKQIAENTKSPEKSFREWANIIFERLRSTYKVEIETHHKNPKGVETLWKSVTISNIEETETIKDERLKTLLKNIE